MKFLSKYYLPICGVFLICLLIGWGIFMQSDSSKLNNTESSEHDKTANTPEVKETLAGVAVTISSAQPTLAPTTAPTLAPNTEPTAAPITEILPTSESNSEPAAPTEAPTPIPTEQVAAPTLAPTATPVPTEPAPVRPDPNYKFDYCIINVNTKLNFRADASATSELIGEFPKNSYARIISKGSEWTKVKSGSVEGYLSTEYLLFDKDAIDKARSLDALIIDIVSTKVNIRKKPDTSSSILGKAVYGETYKYLPEYSADGWYAISYNDEIGYVSSDLVSVVIKLSGAKIN